MDLPLFYAKDILPSAKIFTLDEDTSKHVIMVLRHHTGDAILLADGKGYRYRCIITDDNRKRCLLKIEQVDKMPAPAPACAIGIAFTKSASRNEWFLEKAMEIGIQRIVPLLSKRTEKDKFKMDRLESILISAMMQSQQFYLPTLSEPVVFDQLVKQDNTAQRFIAHCLPAQKTYFGDALQPGKEAFILIGPEGDFTPEEITLALEHGYQPVSLGNTRLRTETAGMVACVLMQSVNEAG
ncbi:16S rRNA (uracil1498-N3)-methyltransferase [Chitinophaga costaii]|uniref:Ribosomal RNA small subunit methyltransferase E n=1 Tax=Chitinophaga costaii TaxID=1335309 RepID=A0A1C4BHU5_9BACT|nr:RsmE family RNA methyltransferase [Chitinophaga costaii]PUZ27609.1 16S rRNA (uracil(1498)-N(3))-methyltransferase [Chitinophaga costaii]SCC06262.1 16S rRNA (uracil1498-N3)-methyltransferase [Chitinophaga costaii]